MEVMSTSLPPCSRYPLSLIHISILGNMVADLIEARTDIHVERNLELGGTQVCFGAMQTGDVDLYIEYSGTAYADTLNAHFAIETGPETSLVLKGFLDSLHSTGVAVNLDPANLVMVTGDDPVKAVHNLKDYIVHTHAKDGRKLDDRDPEVIYGLRPGDPLVTNPAFIELALGTGDVPFPAYLKALDEIGYKGFLTIEREVGDNPAADIKTAVDFLRGIIG